MNDQVATISHAENTLIDLAIRFGPRLFTAALILIAGTFVSGCSRSIRNSNRGKETNDEGQSS